MKNSLTAIILLLLIGCEEPFPIDSIYLQRIENSSKVIYSYSAWSRYSDSNKSGFALMDSTETILISQLEDLPFSYLEGIATKNLIKGIHLVKPKDKHNLNPKPINNYNLNQKNINISVEEKEYEMGLSNSSYITTGIFETFMETKDSLFFYGVTCKGELEPLYPNGIGFRKGNIKLVESSDKKLVQIIINQLSEAYEKGSNKIKSTKEGTYFLRKKNYFFEPKGEIYIKEFSDYGIFKLKILKH
jgi:hypothetical protein